MKRVVRLIVLVSVATFIAGASAQDLALPDTCSSVQLDYWNPFTGPDGPFMGQLVDTFNTANPNISVTMNTLPEYGTQLTTAAASGTLPDVAIIWADQVATYAYRNVFRPMDDVVAQLNLSGENFPAAVWAAGEVNGQRYSVPLDIHPLVMFYNQDLLSAAGTEGAPENRDAFEAAAEAVTGGRDYGFMITTGFPIEQIFRSLLHQFGGSEFNEDGTEATWNSEAGVQALEWMKSAQDRFFRSQLGSRFGAERL